MYKKKRKQTKLFTKTKQYRRRLTVFGGVSCVVILLFLYHLISYISLVNSLTKEQQELQNKLEELRRDNVVLKEEIEKLKNPDYLAKYARENFLYSRDGEYIIRIDENDNIVVEMNEDELKYRQVMVIILGVLVISLIIYLAIRIRKRSLK